MAKIHGQFKSEGLHPTGLEVPGCWMRDRATVRFRCKDLVKEVRIRGTFHPNPSRLHSKYSKKPLGVSAFLNKRLENAFVVSEKGDFEWKIDSAQAVDSEESIALTLQLNGVGISNFLALIGRLFEKTIWLPKRFREWLQPFRRQYNNRQLLIRSIAVNGDTLIDLDRPHSAFDTEFLFKHSKMGLSVLGWFHGYLGVGESARACAKAANSVGLETSTVNLNLHLQGGQSDELWPQGLDREGRHGITIAHVDAPQSFDLAQKHPVEMHKDNYRIGYWAWELPEFPDAWIQYASAFDEIWCPSEFCRRAMAAKLPVPVMTMPHAIEMPSVKGDVSQWRSRFQLPEDKFLFLFSYDLNSYSPRKNPEAVIEAYRKAFANGADVENDGVGLVLKMHGRGYNENERAQLDKLKLELPNLYFVDETLTREELTGLQMSCDCFVSLHRSEGFGLAVAEMMALGKPVISTNWSATSEFVNEHNGCPVDWKLKELEANVGPYTKGQVWADADTDNAALWMQKVVSDDSFRVDISRKGKQFIRTHFDPKIIGERYLNRLKAIALFE